MKRVIMPKKSTSIKHLFLGFVISVCAIVPTATAVDRLVPTTYNTIQEAIDACNNGDTVIVDPNTYTGPGNRDIDFKGKVITVRSTDVNDPNIVAQTIIDCQSIGRGFIFKRGEGSGSVLNGLTIKNGYAEDPNPFYDPNNDPCGYGGAIYCKGSSPKISNCVITDNEADYGGGAIFCDAGSDPNITNCDISYNYCGSYRYDVNQAQIGGGIYCRNSSPIISGCTITENWVEGWWKKGAGGGIACEDSSAVIIDCNIFFNECWALYGVSGEPIDPNYSQHGGGIYCERGSPVIISSKIVDNFANYSGGGIAALDSNIGILGCAINYNFCGASGGGIYSQGTPNPDTSNCYIQNCLIAKNKGYYSGGVSSNHGSLALIVNCTIAKNTLGFSTYTGGLRCTNGDAIVLNSIIWGNSGSSITGTSLYNVTYSDVQMPDSNDPNDPDVWIGVGNINADPLFADPIRYDYHLQSEYGRWDPDSETWVTDANTSPGIDAGNPFSDYSFEPDPNGGRINMGAYGNTPEASKSDADVIRCLPADINCDGHVNFFDYAILADNWLLQRPAINDRRADVNNDGIVYWRDLGILAKFWVR